jgi:hypothetical protein
MDLRAAAARPPSAPASEDAVRLTTMPVADSIRWSPVASGVARSSAPPVFIAQDTLRRIHERLAAAPPGCGIGLLAGRMQTCAQAHTQYLVLNGMLPQPSLAVEHDPRAVLSEGLATAQDAGVSVFGWYRSHSSPDVALTPADVEAHCDVFGDVGRVVLVVSDGGTSGGLFRRSSSPAWPLEALPFYEWVSTAARPDGRRHTTLWWRNYRTAEQVVRQQAMVRQPAAACNAAHPQGVFLPEEVASDDAEFPPLMRSRWRQRVWRRLAYAGTVAVAAVALLGVYQLAPPPAGSALPDVAPGATFSSLPVLDQRADMLTQALQAFDVRERMFAARQMTCADLARGLVRVDADWVSYSAARRASPAALEAGRDARDRALYQGVRAVETRFAGTGCPRP